MTETKNLKLKTYETTTDGQELVARYIDNTSDNFQKIDEFCKTDTTLSVEGGIADAKTVGDNVSKLKDDLYGDKFAIIQNAYINIYNGIQVKNNDFVVSDFIRTDLFSYKVRTKVTNPNVGIAFYDANKEYISGYYNSADNEVLTDIVCPDGAIYFRFTADVDYLDSIVIQMKDNILSVMEDATNEANISISENKKNIDKNYNDISDIKKEIPHYVFTEAEYTSNSGKFYSDKYKEWINHDVYSYSNLFLLKKGECLEVETPSSSYPRVAIVSIWINDETFKETLCTNLAGEHIQFSYIATEDVYIRVCWETSKGITVKIGVLQFSDVFGSYLNNINPIGEYNYLSYAMWKILCIGDSLTSGCNYGTEWSEQYPAGTPIDQNYPRILGRMINAETTNSGIGGYAPSHWYNNESDKYDFSNYDTFIIWLGTNRGLTDTIDTDVNQYADYNDFANTETGYYCKIIEKIKSVNKDCFITLINVFSTTGDKEVTNSTIAKIAEKYELLMIDVSELTFTEYPELHLGINNVHLGKAGNIFIANRIIECVSDYFNQNKLRTEFGYSLKQSN